MVTIRDLLVILLVSGHAFEPALSEVEGRAASIASLIRLQSRVRLIAKTAAKAVSY